MIRLRRPAIAAVGGLDSRGSGRAAAVDARRRQRLARDRRSPDEQRRPRHRPHPHPRRRRRSRDAGAVSLQAPIIKQDLALDCESAALQVALAVKNIDVASGHDLLQPAAAAAAARARRRRLPGALGRSRITAFVGDVNGYEPELHRIRGVLPADRRRRRALRSDCRRSHRMDRSPRSSPSCASATPSWCGSPPTSRPHVPRATGLPGTEPRVPWAIGEHAVPVIGYDPVREHDHVRRRALRRRANHDDAGVRRGADHVWRHGGRGFLRSGDEEFSPGCLSGRRPARRQVPTGLFCLQFALWFSAISPTVRRARRFDAVPTSDETGRVRYAPLSTSSLCAPPSSWRPSNCHRPPEGKRPLTSSPGWRRRTSATSTSSSPMSSAG